MKSFNNEKLNNIENQLNVLKDMHSKLEHYGVELQNSKTYMEECKKLIDLVME